MSRDEALVAVLNAARALRADRQLPSTLSVHLVQLYAAVDAVDAVGEVEPGYRAARGCLPLPPGAPSPEETIRRLRDADEGPPGVCSAADCWRGPITPGGVCFEHSDANQAPRPWERAQLRAGVFAIPEDVS